MDGFLAIDIAKKKLDPVRSTGLVDSGVDLPEVPNSYKGYRKLLSDCKNAGVTSLYVCMEATGAYWQKVAQFFFDHGATVFVVNPARIKGQRKTEQKRTKTDRVDKSVILRFMKAQLPELFPWAPPSAQVRELQSLVRFRESLVAEATAKKNLLKSKAAAPAVAQLARQQVANLERDIAKVEEKIAKLIESTEQLRKQYQHATTVPFIKAITAPVIIAELRAFAEIRDPRQATAFAGLDVMEQQSGTLRKPPRITKQGSRLLRTALFRIAPAACRRPGQFRDLYLRLLARGLKKKQAHVAVARKLLEITVAVIVGEKPFDRDRYKPA